MTVDEIIENLTWFTTVYPREALEEARRCSAEITPRLLDALDYAYDNLEQWANEAAPPCYELHVYAAYLLAEFKEKRAFPKLCALLQFDEEGVDFLWGDTLTDRYSVLLRDTFNGDLQSLCKVIENNRYNKWGSGAALCAYGLLVRDKTIPREDFITYLRYLISDVYTNIKEEDDCFMFTQISSEVISCHLFEMIEDVRLLYDKDSIDTSVHGNYDSFLNYMFEYNTRISSHDAPITNTIEETEWWACFNEDKPEKKIDYDALLSGIEKMPYKGQPEQKKSAPGGKKQKTSRNDPCPCGSGKKYKHCCLGKGVEPKKRSSVEDIYDLMTGYPDLNAAAAEGKPAFKDFYNDKAIEIDIPVYKALHHRSIPLFIARDKHSEDIERIDLLLEAFTKFYALCKQDNIKTLEEFDAKYMVHYRAQEWLLKLQDLLATYSADIPTEKAAYKRLIRQAIRG
ncbi:MAG: DUF1186 domain-containing protein [Treponema sp.]|jgi:hypothetical protein|nr:DUF1186 domain-containing protein [Treponema sp.]